MSSNIKFKMGAFVIILAGAALMFCTVITVFSIISFKNFSSDNIDYMEYAYEKSNNLQDIRLSFENLKRLNDNLLIHSGNTERINMLENTISDIEKQIEYSVNAYLVLTTDYTQEYEMMTNIVYLIDNYKTELTHPMIESAKSGDIYAMEELLLYNAPIRNEISDRLHELLDMRQMRFHETIYSSESDSNRIIIILIMIFMAGSITIVILSAGIFYMALKEVSAELENKLET